MSDPLAKLHILYCWFAVGRGGRAGRQWENWWLVPLWLVPEELSLLAAQDLWFWSSGVGWRALAVSGYLLMQGSFFRGSWWVILSPGVNPGKHVLQGFQAKSSFQESICTLAAVTFRLENKSKIKIFFSSISLCKWALIINYITSVGNLDTSLGAQLRRDVAPCWISCSESLQLFWTVNNLNKKVWSLSNHWIKNNAAILFNWWLVLVSERKGKERTNFMQMNQEEKNEEKVTISERYFWPPFNSKLG